MRIQQVVKTRRACLARLCPLGFETCVQRGQMRVVPERGCGRTCIARNGLRQALRIGTHRRQHVVAAENLCGEVARPSREIPAAQAAGHVGVVEDHGRVRIVEQGLPAFEVAGIRTFVDAHQPDVRLLLPELDWIELVEIANSEGMRAEFAQSVQQLLLRFASGAEDHYAGGRVSHRDAPESAVRTRYASVRLPGRACRDSG